MPSPCPQCGAVLPTEETCPNRFTASQLKEIEQPAYYAVHHLSVPCYMLQHNAYSRRGWLEVRKLLAMFVYDGWTPEKARKLNRVFADSSQRDWSFTKGEKYPGVEEVAWSWTIADVRLDTAENYCADVRRWSERILADSLELIDRVDNSRRV